MQYPIYYFGETWFSILNPKSRDWRLSRGEREQEEDYARALFSDERLAPRVKIFSEIAAPIYQKMSREKHYKHFVYYSSELPNKWKQILFETADKYPVIELVDHPVPRTVQRAQDYLKSIDERRDSYVFCFRVDDDDLITADFLDQVEPLISATTEGFAVSLASGFAGLYENGQFNNIRLHVQPMVAIGLGVIGKWYAASQTLPLEFIRNHTRTHFNRTVLLNAQKPSFFHTRHVGQDTALTEGEIDSSYGSRRKAVLDRLEKLPRLKDPQQLFDSFPELRNCVVEPSVS